MTATIAIDALDDQGRFAAYSADPPMRCAGRWSSSKRCSAPTWASAAGATRWRRRGASRYRFATELGKRRSAEGATLADKRAADFFAEHLG